MLAHTRTSNGGPFLVWGHGRNGYWTLEKAGVVVAGEGPPGAL